MKTGKGINSIRRTFHLDRNRILSTTSHWDSTQSPNSHWDSTQSTTSHWDSTQSPSQRQLLSDSWNETLGGRVELTYISQEVWRIVEPIFNVLHEMDNPDIATEVRELVSIIIEAVLELSQSNFDVSNLPSLTAVRLDDGSFLIEWLFLNYRVGFVVETDPKESFWYLISKRESSDSNLSGSLAASDKKAVLSQLVSYVAMHS